MRKRAKVAIISCLLVAASIFGLKACSLGLVFVNGNSMEPSIMDGSIVFYKGGNFKVCPGDVVIVDLNFGSKHQLIIKRVVGTAGDTISSRHGKLYVNHKRAEEDYAFGRTDCENLVVPDKSVFILGDNWDDSYDSRDFGAVKLTNIVGKIL